MSVTQEVLKRHEAKLETTEHKKCFLPFLNHCWHLMV